MGSKKAQDYLLHLMKSMTETSTNYAHVIQEYGKLLDTVDEKVTEQVADFNASTSRMSFSIDELNRITHQINRCLDACESGDMDKMERLRDELLKERNKFH